MFSISQADACGWVWGIGGIRQHPCAQKKSAVSWRRKHTTAVKLCTPRVNMHTLQDHVMEVKAKMMAAQTAAIEEEKRQAASRLAAKQAEIDLLRFELNQATTRGNKLSDFLKK